MKIVHILFDDYPYILDWGYQENKLAYYQSKKHDVTIITGQYVPTIIDEFVNLNDLEPYEIIPNENNNPIKVYRLKCLFGDLFIAKKIKYYKKLKKILNSIQPDRIVIHDLHSLSLFTVSRFLKKHTNVICNADIHVNDMNSGRNRVSKFMHKYFYKWIIQQNIKNIDHVFYLSENSRLFIKNMYKIDDTNCNLSLLPLGGEVVSISEKNKLQKEFKNKNNIPEEAIIFLHSGKFTKLKKTIELLETFSSVKDNRFYLYVIGQPYEEIKEEFYNAIEKDSRISYLGWKTNEELMAYLKICDVYLQPGSPSVTAHEAMCKGCAILLSNKGNFYQSFISQESAYYISNTQDILTFFKKVSNGDIKIEDYKKNAFNVAKEIFDYEQQGELIIK